jgi:hypothetical protein
MEEELWNAIIESTGAIEKVTVERDFLEWMERLEWAVRVKDEYVRKTK